MLDLKNIPLPALIGMIFTVLFLIAAVFAIVLGLSPKFGAVLQTIPAPVLTGLSISVFGLIAAAMKRRS